MEKRFWRLMKYMPSPSMIFVPENWQMAAISRWVTQIFPEVPRQHLLLQLLQAPGLKPKENPS